MTLPLDSAGDAESRPSVAPPSCDTSVQTRHSAGDCTRKHAEDRVEPTRMRRDHQPDREMKEAPGTKPGATFNLQQSASGRLA
jgi:hypothetical protein